MPAMKGPVSVWGGRVVQVFGYVGLGLADLDGFGACRRDAEGYRDDGEVTQKHPWPLGTSVSWPVKWEQGPSGWATARRRESLGPSAWWEPAQ